MVLLVGEDVGGQGYLSAVIGGQQELAFEDGVSSVLTVRNCQHGLSMALCSPCLRSQPDLDAGDEARANSLSQQDMDIQREHFHAETQQESLQDASDELCLEVDTVSLGTEPIALAHAAAASPRKTEEAAVQDLSATSRRTEDRVQEPTREKRMARHDEESQNEAPLPASNRKERASQHDKERNPADVDEHSPLGKSAPDKNNLTADQANLCRPPEGGVSAMPRGSPRPDVAVVSMPGMAVRSPPPKPPAQNRAGTSRGGE